MATSVRNNGDLFSGAVLAGLGVFIIIEARRWDYLAADGPGPGFFPMWYGLALLVLSAVLMITSVTGRQPTAGKPIVWREVGRAAIAWAGLAASIALLKVLGFFVSFALLTFFIVSLMYRRPFMHGIVAGVLAAGTFYLIFPLALNVRLPVGLFGF